MMIDSFETRYETLTYIYRVKVRYGACVILHAVAYHIGKFTFLDLKLVITFTFLDINVCTFLFSRSFSTLRFILVH